MRYLPILALTTAMTVGSLSAQSDRVGSISIGAKIGAPINEANQRYLYGSSYTSQGRWTGGPTVEVQLPFRFAIEFDALYRNSRTNNSFVFPLGGTNSYNVNLNENINTWDFPLLLKYRFHAGPVRPFLSAGIQFNHDSIDSSSQYTCFGPATSCLPASYPLPAPTGGRSSYTRDTAGPVAGAGVEIRTRYLSISPELRYNNYRPANGARENRFTALVGFTFGLRK